MIHAKVSQKSPKNVPKTLRLELVKGYKKKITANKVGVSKCGIANKFLE